MEFMLHEIYSKCPEEREADAEPDDLPGAEAASPDANDYERLREPLLECNTNTRVYRVGLARQNAI